MRRMTALRTIAVTAIKLYTLSGCIGTTRKFLLRAIREAITDVLERPPIDWISRVVALVNYNYISIINCILYSFFWFCKCFIICKTEYFFTVFSLWKRLVLSSTKIKTKFMIISTRENLRNAITINNTCLSKDLIH